ncbi:MAG: cadherin-like domain-containing protein, partial [Deltaproteobacteria bacterium]|nr:cadherin-like domain-containing protein [Deltaproteobacteria bacterium]
VTSATFDVNGYRTSPDAASISETLNISINSVNDGPSLISPQPAMPAGKENSDYTFSLSSLIAGYGDVEGDAISLVTGSLAADSGSFSIDGDLVTFSPDANFSGTVNLSYQLEDSNGATVNASQSFELAPVNDPPVRTDNSGFDFNFSIDEDGGTTSLGLGVLSYGPGGGSDEQAQTLTVSIDNLPDPALGSIRLADGITPLVLGQTLTLEQLAGLTFSPAANAFGDTSFSFSISDSGSPLDAYVADPISGFDLTKLELALRSDLSGDGVTGLTINQQLFSETSNGTNTYLYKTSQGLLLSSASGLNGSANALGQSGQHILLTQVDNNGVTSGFTINSLADGPAMAGEFIVGTSILNSGGYSIALTNASTANDIASIILYTRQSDGSPSDPNTSKPVNAYTFSPDGILQSTSILSPNELIAAEIATKRDLDGNSTTGVRINQQLTSSTPTGITPGSLYAYSTQNGGLFLSSYNAYGNGSDIPSGVGYSTNILLSNSESLPFALGNTESFVAARGIENSSNVALYVRSGDPVTISQYTFNAQGVQQGDAIALTGDALLQAEINTRIDLSGNGTTAFRFESELLSPNTPGTSDPNALRVSSTSAGLVLTTQEVSGLNHRTDGTGSDLASLTGSVSSFSLVRLTIADGSAFSINTGDTVVGSLRQTEWKSPQPGMPNGTTLITGYELYTRDASNTVTLHQFNTDGKLLSSDVLDELSLVQAELKTRQDLNGSGRIALTVQGTLINASYAGNGNQLRGLVDTDQGLL